MDRFAWTDGLLAPDEQLMCQQEGVRLYDGDGKVIVFNFVIIVQISSSTSFSVLPVAEELDLESRSTASWVKTFG